VRGCIVASHTCCDVNEHCNEVKAENICPALLSNSPSDFPLGVTRWKALVPLAVSHPSLRTCGRKRAGGDADPLGDPGLIARIRTLKSKGVVDAWTSMASAALSPLTQHVTSLHCTRNQLANPAARLRRPRVPRSAMTPSDAASSRTAISRIRLRPRRAKEPPSRRGGEWVGPARRHAPCGHPPPPYPPGRRVVSLDPAHHGRVPSLSLRFIGICEWVVHRRLVCTLVAVIMQGIMHKSLLRASTACWARIRDIIFSTDSIKWRWIGNFFV